MGFASAAEELHEGFAVTTDGWRAGAGNGGAG
jgi:hypothetical protein